MPWDNPNIEVDQKSGRNPISFFLRVLVSVISMISVVS